MRLRLIFQISASKNHICQKKCVDQLDLGKLYKLEFIVAHNKCNPCTLWIFYFKLTVGIKFSMEAKQLEIKCTVY